MDDIIGFAVVGIIIACLIYALIKQVIETKQSVSGVGSPMIRKQLVRRNIVMTIALFGFLVFYILNVVSGITSSIQISDNFTARGALLSFFVYFFARIVMKPKQVNHSRNLYN